MVLQGVADVFGAAGVEDHTENHEVVDRMLEAEDAQADLPHQTEGEEDHDPDQEVDQRTGHEGTDQDRNPKKEDHIPKKEDHALMVDVHNPKKGDQLLKKDVPDQRKEDLGLLLQKVEKIGHLRSHVHVLEVKKGLQVVHVRDPDQKIEVVM